MLTFSKKQNQTKKSPKLYTSYRNTSISNVEMTSLWKVGLYTEVTCIALLCLEEASSWCDSSAPRRDRLLLCSWGRRAMSKEVKLSILFHRQGDFQGKTTCRHCIQLPNNAPQISNLHGAWNGAPIRSHAPWAPVARLGLAARPCCAGDIRTGCGVCETS